MPQTLTINVVPCAPESNAVPALEAHPADLPLDGPDVEIPANAPLMRRESSPSWLPAQLARRLIAQHGAQCAGLRAIAQRNRHGVGRPGHWTRLNAPRWVYWDVVCIAIERQTGRRFRRTILSDPASAPAQGVA